jgi:hypothetical protein
MKAPSQPRGLVHNVPGRIREYNRHENFLDAQHHGFIQLCYFF